MSSQIRLRFQRRFMASSLFLQSVNDYTFHAAESQRRCNEIVAMLDGVRGITRADERIMSDIVWERSGVWQPDDIQNVMFAIAVSSQPTRRQMQNFAPTLMHTFTEAERDRWNTNASSSHAVLFDIVNRVKCLGGKNLCEYTKKLVVAMYMHYRKDFWTMEFSARTVVTQNAREFIAKQLKHFEPLDYTAALPSDFGELQRLYTDAT